MKSNHKLINNTIMLYILTFSTYFFNFITIPYQTRVLGPSCFARIGFASAFVAYFQMFVDFGFILSGTEQVARNRESKEQLSKIYSAICIAKIILIVMATIVFFPIVTLYQPVRENGLAVVLYYLSICVFTFFPDYLYRGLENMKSITVRNVLIRIFFTTMIFIFVKKPEDYLMIPILTVIGNFVAVVATFLHVKKAFNVRFVAVSFREVKEQLKISSIFFYSRIASTVYNSTNIFIIGILYGTASLQLGYFSSANKLVSTAKQGITPITDSLYPYMVSEKNYKTLKRALVFFMPLITIACIIGYIFADYICIILFGADFIGAGIYFRLLLPLIWISFPAMLFGFPALSPMGLSKYVNYSNIIGAALQIGFLLLGYVTGNLNIIYICIVTCLSDFCTMGYRIAVFLLHK